MIKLKFKDPEVRKSLVKGTLLVVGGVLGLLLLPPELISSLGHTGNGGEMYFFLIIFLGVVIVVWRGAQILGAGAMTLICAGLAVAGILIADFFGWAGL